MVIIMRYYELWIVLLNWKKEFTVRGFARSFASPDTNKVLHDMTKKGFLEKTGWGKYRVMTADNVFRARTDITKSYDIVSEAKMKYAFAEQDAVFIWTKGGYQADRFAGFYPISIKIRRRELRKWKSFLASKGRPFCIFGSPLKETLFGVFYILHPEDDFKAEKSGKFSVVSLAEAVDFCKRHIYSYEPALEMLDEMYKLGLKIKYRESATNIANSDT